jgi:hypothetical protein
MVSTAPESIHGFLLQVLSSESVFLRQKRCDSSVCRHGPKAQIGMKILAVRELHGFVICTVGSELLWGFLVRSDCFVVGIRRSVSGASSDGSY